MLKINDKSDVKDFLLSISKYSDSEIINSLDDITKYLTDHYSYALVEIFLVFVIRNIKDHNIKLDLIKQNFFYGLDAECCYNWNRVLKSIDNLSKDDQISILRKISPNISFEEVSKLLDIPTNLKFGLELEYCLLSYDVLHELFNSNSIIPVMEAIGIPKYLIDEILSNYTFTLAKTNEFNTWVFSPEGIEEPEASSPVMSNNLYCLNQIKAICMIFKALKANTRGGTGLHINIGTDYFDSNIKALKFLLLIWAECEEIFFKIANAEGQIIRFTAPYMAQPIKSYIQKTMKENPDFTLDSEEELEEFLYKIQVRDRIEDIIDELTNSELKDELKEATTEKEKCIIFRKYLQEKEFYPACERFTSVNFNHMNWGRSPSDRIEFRIFNNSLSFEVIMQDLLLVAKLFETSLQLANKSKDKIVSFKALLNKKVTEEIKLELLLDLLFDKDEEQEIYRRRWHSIVEKSDEYECFYTGRKTFIYNFKNKYKKQ